MQKPLAFFYKEFRNDISYTFSFLSRWVGIILSVVMFYYLAKFMSGRQNAYLQSYGGDYFSFVLVGLAGVSYLNSAINGFAGTVTREQWAGTLEALLATPTRLRTLALSFSLYNLFMGLLAALFYFILGNVFGARFNPAGMASVLCVTLLATCAFLGLGMLSAASVVVFKRGDPIAWIITNLFWLLGGVYFPVSVFPLWLQKIAFWLPSTYALRAWRLALFQGSSPFALKEDLTILSFFAVVLLVLGSFVLKYAIVYAKKRGTIAFY